MTSKEEYESYDNAVWEHTYFNKETGGYLVTELSRITEGERNHQTMSDFAKEREAALKYASWGFQIEHLADRRNVGGNPDARVWREGPSVRVNGLLADIKTVTTPKKFVKRVNEAFEQGSKMVLLHLTYERNDRKLKKQIESLKENGRRGYYYFDGENRYYEF